MTVAATAAVGAAVVLAGVAAFQLGLALGLPLGEATLGGRAPTRDGVLSGGFRLIPAVSVLVLVLAAWIVLARAGVVAAGPLGHRFLVGATWGLVAFLALNTVGNLAAPHPVERWVMGAASLVVVLLCSVVAISAE